MTIQKMAEIVAEFGLPYAYHHFAEGESPEPPFCVYLTPESESFGADNIVYHCVPVWNVELYTDKKDPEQEVKIEEVLTEHELWWQKSEVWIESEKLYETLYQIY